MIAYVQLDGDGQHPANELNKLMQPILDETADIVIGSRFIVKDGFQSSFFRRIGISFLSSLIWLKTKKRIIDVTSGFRVVNRKYIDFFAQNYAQDYPEPEAIVTSIKNGAKVIEIPVTMRERQGGESSINFIKSIYYMIKVSLAITLK